MDTATAHVLFDVATLGVGALVIGLGIFAYVRRRDSHIGWQYHGNVWTEPFDLYDLAAAGLIVMFFYSNVALPLMIPAEEMPAGDSPEPVLDDIGTIITLTAFSALMGLGVFTFATFLRGRNAVQLFGLNRLSPGKIFAWAAGSMIPIYLSIAAVIYLIWRPFFEGAWGTEPDLQNVVESLMASNDPLLRGVLVVSAVVVAPLVEEVIFRGYLYPVLKRYSDRFFSAIFTSLLFAVVHGNVPGMLPLFTLALLLTLSYELTGCLWVPVAAHSLFNAIQTALMLNFGDA